MVEVMYQSQDRVCAQNDSASFAALVARPSHHFLVFFLPHSLAAFFDE